MPTDDMNALALTGAGMPYPLAAEIMAALKSGQSTSAAKLMSFGLSSTTAMVMAAQVNARTFDARALHTVGVQPAVAAALARF